MGEQVAGAAGYGWLDGVRADLARENYASRGVDIPACSVDAPHIRQRLYWVASDMADAKQHGSRCKTKPANNQPKEIDGPADQHGGCSGAFICGDMADADLSKSGEGRRDACEVCGVPIAECGTKNCSALLGRGSGQHSSFWSDHIWLTGADGKARRSKPGLPLLVNGVSNRVGRLRAYGNAIVPPLAAEVIRSFMEAEG
jgi:DNA (cytosine-5)-methyltransferase 1